MSFGHTREIRSETGDETARWKKVVGWNILDDNLRRFVSLVSSSIDTLFFFSLSLSS